MKNSDKPGSFGRDSQNSQKENTGQKNTHPDGNPYDSENLDNERDSSSKDITEKDIEKYLINNDPSEGFETDVDTDKNDEDESDTFETIGSDQENPLNKECEIGQLGSEELQEDEGARDKTDNGAVHFNKPSERKF